MSVVGPSSAPSRTTATFRRTVRLLLNRDFQRVFDARCSIAGKTMVIWIAPPGSAETRMGVVASKRTFRRAVDRNRAKRLIREAFRRERYRLCQPADLVIVARRRILDAGSEMVQAEFVKLAGALGMTAAEEINA
jgi:ribonuclease P protein component